MIPPNRFAALRALAPTSKFCMDGNTNKILHSKLKNGESLPTDEEIDAKLVSMLSDWEAQEYARNRKYEYRALNQFEMQFDDKEDGTTTWEDAIQAIKTKWPKDNSGPVE